MFQVTFVFDSHEDDFWPSYIGRQCRELIHLRDCLAFHAEEVNRIAKTAASPITLCNRLYQHLDHTDGEKAPGKNHALCAPLCP